MTSEGTDSRIDQGELEMLERRFQLSGDLEYETQSQVDFIGPAVDRIDVQQLLERLHSPVKMTNKGTDENS